MYDTPTPGALAYAAWWAALSPRLHPPAYAALSPRQQRAWEAAAQAVRALDKEDRDV